MQQRWQRQLARAHQQRDQAIAAAREAEHAARHKGEFLATMSHEIRTPLNSMIGTAELLLETEMNARQKAQLTTVLDSADTLLAIINDILDYSKIEGGKLSLRESGFNLHALIMDTIIGHSHATRNPTESNRTELGYRIAPGVPQWVFGDAPRLRQVLDNLLSNALKFTATGSVTVRVSRNDALQIVFEVADTGIGIDETKRKHLFEKYAQCYNHEAGQYGGSGLGLSISRELVQLMHGTIALDSTLGKGSCFTIALPLAPLPDKANASATHTQPWAGRRVLIFDDNAAIAQLLHDVLTDFGLRCYACYDLTSAVQACEQAYDGGMYFDYLFVQENMAEQAGEQLIEAMRTAPHHHPTTIIMTRQNSAGRAAAASELGARALLRKPIHAHLVHRILHDCEAATNSLIDSDSYSDADDTTMGYADYTGRRVLLVEDNRVNRELAVEILGKFNLTVVTAEHGEEALARAQSDAFDLIFMDCQMPVMDGFAASRILRQRMREGIIRRTPIIALTAHAMKGDREQCLDAGMSDYLCKPLRLGELKRMLRHWLEDVPQARVA